VSNKYATDVKQLGLGMSKLAPIAKTMGLSFEETAGILTPVIEVFGRERNPPTL
jgi:TP901 family phage tail tape measure protein